MPHGKYRCLHVTKDDEHWARRKQSRYLLLKVPVLITPLGRDPQGVFNKSDHDEETANGRQMRPQGLRVNVDHIFNFRRISSNLLERIIWVGWCSSLVRWRLSTKAVRIISIRGSIGVPCSVSRTCNVYSRRHFFVFNGQRSNER